MRNGMPSTSTNRRGSRPIMARSPTFPPLPKPPPPPGTTSTTPSTFHLHNCPLALAALKRRREESRKRGEVAASSLAKSSKRAAVAPHVVVSSSQLIRRKHPNLVVRMSEPECTGFEPQNYLKERCKKCFRLREKHEGLSPLRKFAEKNEEKVLVLSPKTTPKRTQSIPTALRRVPVRRRKDDGDEDGEGRGGGEAKEDGTAGKEEKKRKGGEEEEKPRSEMKVIKVETQQPREEAKMSGGGGGGQTQQQAQEPTPAKSPRTTTTVLLPKQRQISLGSSTGSSANAAKERRPAVAAKRREDEGEKEEEKCRNGRGEEEARKGSGRNGWQFMGGTNFGGGSEGIQNGGGGGDAESGEEDLLSLSSYRTAHSRAVTSNSQGGEMFSARSVDSLNSLSYAESFKTGKSPPFDEDDPFATPTSTDSHFFLVENAAAGELDARALTPTQANQLEFSHLRLENQRLTEQCRRYRHERRRWTEWLKRQRGGGGGERTAAGKGGGKEGGDGQRVVEEALTELELMVSEYREENSALKCELDRVKERDDEMSASALTLNAPCIAQQQHQQQQLEERLQAADAACEQLKKEREELEQELEEMQDQYRVEEIEEFRELQRELEQNAKNCRILQFKLRKSERQREQVQTEKNLLAKKYQQEMAATGKKKGMDDDGDGEDEREKQPSEAQRRVAELEQELRVAKEISVKLHNELETAEERRYRLEDELFYNKEKVRELLAQNKWREAKNSREQQTRTKEVLSGERPEQELHREVRDSLEREADLREQLRFTEADLQRTRHRLRELELESDELLQKYTKLADQQAQAAQQAALDGAAMLLAVPKRPGLFRRSVSEGSNDGGKAAQKEGGGGGGHHQDGQMSPKKLRKISESDETKAERRDSAADAEQLCYMLAAMDAQANRICKQLEKLESGGGGGGAGDEKREKRRSLKGDIVPVLEELGGLLAEMKAIKEQLAKSQNISLTKSMIIGSVLGDHKQRGELMEESEGGREGGGGGESSCSECEDSERKVDELRESCDFYKRKNAELTEQILQMKDQWAGELRKTEDEADARRRRLERELDGARAEADEQRVQAKAAEKALEESRAEAAAANKRQAEANQEMERATRERVGGVEKGLEAARKWETRCKEMKAERIRLQAEVGQLKRRTDEAMQELEKMRTTHQQKEISWIRERLKLEEQLKKRQEEGTAMANNGQLPPLTNGQQEQWERGTEERDVLRGRVAQLEKEKEKLEKELDEGRRGGGGGKEAEEAEKQKHEGADRQKPVQIVQIQRGGGGVASRIVIGPPGEERAARPPSRVDYKQIADNALRAAESLQRQYREYQRQYTAEVQRLNSQLGHLEAELADRERRLRSSSQMQTPVMQQQQQPTSGGGIQQQGMTGMQIVQIRRAAESPSMSSLTENTTWDSRLLDCSMTRSISPFKFPRGNCPMMQCRTLVDIHPNNGIGGVGGGQPGGDIVVGDFGSEEDVHREYRRTGSSGTNILYRIRREELSKGKNPSVRQMAKAFENFEKVQADKDGQKRKKNAKTAKSPLFGLISKASSVEHQQSAASSQHSQLPPSKHRRKQSRGESPVPSEPSVPMCATLPRGGRNPFKGMGSRIVERVRRSLSRSKKSQSRDGTPSLHTGTMSPSVTMGTAPPDEPTVWK